MYIEIQWLIIGLVGVGCTGYLAGMFSGARYALKRMDEILK